MLQIYLKPSRNVILIAQSREKNLGRDLERFVNEISKDVSLRST